MERMHPQPQVQRKLRRLRSPAALALFTGTVALGGLTLALAPSQDAHAQGPDGLVERLGQLALDATIHAEVPQGSLAPLIEKVQPAVVSVRSFGSAPGGFFRGVPGQVPGHPMQRGVGSGFIIDSDGIVVTNHHVVDKADSLQVKLDDGRLVAAKVLGSDPFTDLAVLQLEGVSGLPTVKIGSSDTLRVGDFVLAIGSPMGLEQTVTRGIVSAKGRGDLGLYANSYVDFIQTDAAISPGSSGGPLINMRGEVVAVNTAVSGGGQGLGFAVPAHQVKTVVPQLRKVGKVERGWLGIAGRDVEPVVGQLPERGAVVGEVYDGTPAAAAGLRKADRIVRLDGHDIENFSDLRGRIAEHKPRERVQLEIERDGKRQTLSVKLGDLAAQMPTAAKQRLMPVPRAKPHPIPSPGPKATPPRDDGKPRLGVEVVPTDEGLQVVGVGPNTLAAEVGLQPGDVIEQINGQPIAKVEDVADALGKDPKGVAVQVDRNGARYVGTIQHH